MLHAVLMFALLLIAYLFKIFLLPLKIQCRNLFASLKIMLQAQNYKQAAHNRTKTCFVMFD